MKSAYLYHPLFLQHNDPGHPEHAGRLQAIMTYLKQHSLLSGLEHFSGRAASEAELQLVHNLQMIARVKELSHQPQAWLDADTYMNASSLPAALQAAGGLISLVDALLDGRIANGLALVRPPGHHATPLRSMGFCLFNSVAIAAAHAVKQRGLKRVAIVDYDVHHGNGTQEIFNQDSCVLYISSHGYPLYPGTGHYRETGGENAKNTIVNLPLPAGCGDTGSQRLYSKIAFPVLRRFQPELILVSAGFDAHFADPLANVDFSLAGFHWLNRQLLSLAEELCHGRILFSLEGGYNLQVLGPATGNLIRLFNRQEDFDDPLGPGPAEEPDIAPLVAELLTLHNLTD